MPTSKQLKDFTNRLKVYKKRYVKKQYSELDESATRLMINSLLTEVFGYQELEEIKTEYRIRGEYADYIIQLARKKHFVVEVKSIQLDLNDKHLRQSTNYAANEGIDWVILTNGKQVDLYKVLFSKPINVKKIFSFDFSNDDDFKKMPEFLYYLTKKSVEKNELGEFWKRFEALAPLQLSKSLYDKRIVALLKKSLKKKTGLTFNEGDIMESVYTIITSKIDSVKPKCPIDILQERAKKAPKILTLPENEPFVS